MSRVRRADVFDPNEIAIVHVINRTSRRCFLMGLDPVTGQCFDHRKKWMEDKLKQLAASFGIDLFTYAILSNHFHLILRSRPDVVATWSDVEIAKRWLTLCPPQKNGKPRPIQQSDLNMITSNPDRLAILRLRLSDISWLMRLLSQPIAQRANLEDNETGRFWAGRFRAIRLEDESALLACSAYVDLNLIRAKMAETLEGSNYTSIQARIKSEDDLDNGTKKERLDSHLAPISLDTLTHELGSKTSTTGKRCSDLGFVDMSPKQYIALLNWTIANIVPEKSKDTFNPAPAHLARLNITPDTWCGLVKDFGRLFSLVAGRPESVESYQGKQSHRRFYLRREVRETVQVGRLSEPSLLRGRLLKRDPADQ